MTSSLKRSQPLNTAETPPLWKIELGESWHVDAITAVDVLSNLTVMNPAENPAGGGLLEPVV